MKLTDYKVLTFDTYGTLIDWESGIWTAMQPLLARCADAPGRDKALELFASAESAQQAETPAMIYSELLTAVHGRLASELGVANDDAEAEAFGGSVKNWPAFDDAPDALAYLKQHYTMITLTNCDKASYEGSDARLGRPWHAIYTAQEVGSYKPSPRNFEFLLAHLDSEFGFKPGDVLHTAQSLFHDHVPATAAGLATCWINRRHGQEGGGATAPPGGDYRIDIEFPSMAAMVEAHKAELAAG